MPEQTVAVAMAAAFGASTTAAGRFFLGARKVDKVDAVQAIALAYDRVAERTNKQIDDLNRRVDYLEREIRKRDELIFNHIIDKKVTIEPAPRIQSDGSITRSHGSRSGDPQS